MVSAVERYLSPWPPTVGKFLWQRANVLFPCVKASLASIKIQDEPESIREESRHTLQRVEERKKVQYKKGREIKNEQSVVDKS